MGFESVTSCLIGRRSNQLSYGSLSGVTVIKSHVTFSGQLSK